MKAGEETGKTVLDARIPSLDGLRGVAIILVMIHHFTVIQPATAVEIWFGRVARLGMHGVDLFFVLSGFLITGILLDSKGEQRFLRNFYMRRTLRIFPLYYAVVAFSFLIVPTILANVPGLANKLSRFQVASHDWVWYVFYCSNFSIGRADAFRHGILDVTWSLAIEEQFYLVWAIVVLFFSGRTLLRICVGAIFGAFVIRCGMWLAGYSWLQIYVLTPGRIDALAWGAALALLMRRRELKPGVISLARKGSLIPIVVIALLFSLGLMEYSSPVSFTIGYSVVGLLFAQCLVIAVHAPETTIAGKVFASRLLGFFGKYSYAIYLFHLPARAILRDLFFGDKRFRALPGWPLLWQLVFYIVATAAVVPLALLSWNLYEKHFLKLKKYFPAKTRLKKDTHLNLEEVVALP
jgi:peptidoglycan/LPS O-acetylase OafA/YrhL